jgi:chitodextrinase
VREIVVVGEYLVEGAFAQSDKLGLFKAFPEFSRQKQGPLAQGRVTVGHVLGHCTHHIRCQQRTLSWTTVARYHTQDELG